MNRGSSVVNWICVEDPFLQIRPQNIGKGETSRKVHYVAITLPSMCILISKIIITLLFVNSAKVIILST